MQPLPSLRLAQTSICALALLLPACRVDHGGTQAVPSVNPERPPPATPGPPVADASPRDAGGAEAHPPAGADAVVAADAGLQVETALPSDSATATADATVDAASDVPPSGSVSVAGNRICDSGLALPARARRLDGPRGDDLTFVASGDLVAFDGRDVVRFLREGRPETLVNNAIGQRGGALAGLPTGQLFIADFERAAVSVREPDGQLRRLPAHIDDPMKMVAGPGGSVYVSNKGGTITRIEAATGAAAAVGTTDFEIGGLTFSSDYKTLFVGGLTVDGVFAFDVSLDGKLGQARPWRSEIARAQALATDECNNVYVISENEGRVRRITPRLTVETVVDLRAPYLWALAFGSRKQGWSRTALYVEEANAGGLYEVELGVAGQPPP